MLRIVDHCFIFHLIAGPGVPFCLCALSTFSESVAAFYNVLMWGCGVVGIILLGINLERFKWLSVVRHLGIG